VTTFADLELSLHQQATDSYAVELHLSLPGNDADIRPVGVGVALATFDLKALRSLSLDNMAYGEELSRSLFSDPKVWMAYTRARDAAAAQDAILRVRLSIGVGAATLHGLRWETLHDLEEGTPLFTGEQIVFSRYLSSLDWRPVRLRPRGSSAPSS
jgi:hypothetical protein